jgi:hypothetical protein
MLNGGDAGSILFKNSSPFGFHYIFRQGINDGLPFQVGSLEDISMTVGGGLEGHIYLYPSVEAFTLK